MDLAAVEMVAVGKGIEVVVGTAIVLVLLLAEGIELGIELVEAVLDLPSFQSCRVGLVHLIIHQVQ
tara:strand:- start:105 stop:302 length:198 start_codon:yes stop_codon:yes gene_type:complete